MDKNNNNWQTNIPKKQDSSKNEQLTRRSGDRSNMLSWGKEKKRKNIC